MKKGSILSGTVERLADDGRGVVMVDGGEVRIVGAAIGDEIRFEIQHKSQHEKVAWASIVTVLQQGQQFVDPPCRHVAQLSRGRCGGCPVMHLAYADQLALKSRILAAELSELWSDPIELNPSPLSLHYRNRANYVAVRLPSGQIRLGSYEARSHQVARMDGCLAVRKPIAAVALELEQLLGNRNVPIHPQNGGLRYVTIRANQRDQVLVELVPAAAGQRWPASLARQIGKLDPVVGVSVSINESTGNAIRVGPSQSLEGLKTVAEKLGELLFQASAASFTQLNSDVAAAMYAQAAKWAGDGGVLWDLYCGIGGLGLTVAGRRGSKLFGAESQQSLVELARSNAAAIGVDGVFEIKDLRRELPAGWPAPTTVLINPPRRGIDKRLLQRLPELAAETLIYMSCNAQSFARDVTELTAAGFKLESLEAWDMLPQTTHFELLGLLRRV